MEIAAKRFAQEGMGGAEQAPVAREAEAGGALQFMGGENRFTRRVVGWVVLIYFKEPKVYFVGREQLSSLPPGNECRRE